MLAVKVPTVNVGVPRVLERFLACLTFAWPLKPFVAQVVQLQEIEQQ
jgi:hypothetical protein